MMGVATTFACMRELWHLPSDIIILSVLNLILRMEKNNFNFRENHEHYISQHMLFE